VAIRGPLRELGIHDVFQLLDLSRKTGTLKVTSDLRQNEGTIWFDSGAVVGVTVLSNPHRIGQALVRTGRIREEDLLRAAAMQVAGDSRLIGELLVEIGAISTRELERLVRTQVEEVIFAMLGWSEGWFVFEEGPVTEVPRDAPIRIAVEALLMEGARRIDEWDRLQARIPHLAVVPQLIGGSGEGPGSLALTPPEWKVLGACDGILDVRGISHALGTSEFEVARTLFGLAAADVITIGDPASAAAGMTEQDPATLLAQGEEYLRRGDPLAGRTLAEAAVASGPADPRAHLLLGRCLFAAGRFGEAEPALRTAASHRDSDSGQALRLLGLARAAQGRLGDAVLAWEEWLGLAQWSADEERHLPLIVRLVDAARVLANALGGAP
jgi:hypothetical protein